MDKIPKNSKSTKDTYYAALSDMQLLSVREMCVTSGISKC